MNPLRVRLFTQPADDLTWMHFRFTREPDEAERHAIAKAVSLFLATPTTEPDTGRGLREALEDCVAYIRGEITGPSQRDGILAPALAALSDTPSGRVEASREPSPTADAAPGRSATTLVPDQVKP